MMGIIQRTMGRRWVAAGTVALVALLSMTACDREDAPPDEAAAPAEEQAAEGPTVEQGRQLLQAEDYAAAAALFREIIEREPDNARAWMLLGAALQSDDKLDEALEAHLKAVEFEETARRGMYNAACAYALKGDEEKAFKWLGRLHESGAFDMTRILVDPDLESLEDDPRFAAMLPGPEQFADPFVETVRVIHEWAGEAEGDAFGWIARNVGDVDGDGINDVTTSAPNREEGGQRAGRVYVYSGRTGELLWNRTGEAGERLGLGIEAAGDTNADGIPDVIAGAPGAGRTYVYSGNDGTILLTLAAEQDDESFGGAVSDVGDLDEDGYADVLVGAPDNDETGEDAGRATVFSGRDGSTLLTLYGEEAGDKFGSAVSGSGDGEGTLLIVGAPDAGPEDRGRAYVHVGRSTEPAYVLEAGETGVEFGGMFVSIVGDVNRDGARDLYASDWSDGAKGPATGRIYVHSGKDGRRLFTLTGEAGGDGFGIGPADAGDVNGDGHDDLIVGAWQHSGAAPGGGKVYLYSGKDASLMRAVTCKVQGDTFGFDATGMGDVDGDGRIDFLLTSAWSAINGGRSGRMFIVAGR
jgi:tetratricopeptide (TPR) repeat protein